LSSDHLATLSRDVDGALADDERVFSNRANVAWYILDEPVEGLPKSCLGGGRIPDPRFDEELLALGQQLEGPRAVLLFEHKACEPFSVKKVMSDMRVSLRAKVDRIRILAGP
jgi:hypothetical protein